MSTEELLREADRLLGEADAFFVAGGLQEAVDRTGHALGLLAQSAPDPRCDRELRPGAHLIRGQAFARLGRLHEAEAHIGRAAELRPDVRETWFDLGRIAQRLGRWTDACAHFDRAESLGHDDPRLYYNRACCRARIGQYDAMLRDLGLAIQLDPDLRARASADAHFADLRDRAGLKLLLKG